MNSNGSIECAPKPEKLPPLSTSRSEDLLFTDQDRLSIKSLGEGKAEAPVQSSPTDSYGIAVARVVFDGETSVSGITTHHMIGVGTAGPVETFHVIEGKRAHHQTGPGTICLCPAEMQHYSHFKGTLEGVVLRIAPECLALAKAAHDIPHASLVEQIDGSDVVLAELAVRLEVEAANDHLNGMLYWSTLTNLVLGHLVRHHMSRRVGISDGRLSTTAVKRVQNFISENLSEPIDLDRLAKIAECGRFQFARLFKTTVGISPYRYVVRKRLEVAVHMLHRRKDSLAEISAATGFSDQSHMTRWIKRVYGVTPAKLIA